MLSLQLKTGDYMTIGGNVVVQLDRISGNRCKLMVQAPRDMAILRGEVLDRRGATGLRVQRPAPTPAGGFLEPEQVTGTDCHAAAAEGDGRQRRGRKNPAASARLYLSAGICIQRDGLCPRLNCFHPADGLAEIYTAHRRSKGHGTHTARNNAPLRRSRDCIKAQWCGTPAIILFIGGL